MKKLYISILLSIIAVVLIQRSLSQIVVGGGTYTTSWVLDDAHFVLDGVNGEVTTVQFTGTKVDLDTNNVVLWRHGSKVLTLTGTNLDAAFSGASLPLTVVWNKLYQVATNAYYTGAFD